MNAQRGNDEIAGIIALACLAAFVWWLAVDNEREGFAKYDDCRETVLLQADTFQKYYKTFTCNTRKTQSGAVMGGECVHVDYDSSLFSSGHACKVAYVYQKKGSAGCTDRAHPYLGYDDKCYPTPQ